MSIIQRNIIISIINFYRHNYYVYYATLTECHGSVAAVAAVVKQCTPRGTPKTNNRWRTRKVTLRLPRQNDYVAAVLTNSF